MSPSPHPTRRVARGAARALRGLLVWLVAGVVVYPLRVVGFGLVAIVVWLPASWWSTGALALVCAVAATVGFAQLAVRRRRADVILSDLSSASRRLRLARRVRRRWHRTMLDAGLSKAHDGAPGAGRRVPRRRRVRITATGVSLRVRVASIGATGDDLRAKASSLRSAFHVDHARVRDIRPGWCQVDLRLDPPFRTPIRLADLPKPTRAQHVTVGVDVDDQGVEVDLRLPRLVVGATGAGKSNEVWSVLAGLQRAGTPYRLRALDPKGGMELGSLAAAAYAYCDSPLGWPKFLGSTLAAMEARQRDMAARGVHKLSRFTWENPLDLLIIDELVAVLALRRGDVKVGNNVLKSDEALLLLLSQGRACGFNVLACSQIADKDAIGPVRSLFSYASCLRLGALESAMVNVVLGSGAANAHPAHKLPPGDATAGIGWCASPSGEVVQYRGALVSDMDRARIARQLAADTRRVRAARTTSRREEDQEVSA